MEHWTLAGVLSEFCWLTPFFKLDLSGWPWFIKPYTFQVSKSMKHLLLSPWLLPAPHCCLCPPLPFSLPITNVVCVYGSCIYIYIVFCLIPSVSFIQSPSHPAPGTVHLFSAPVSLLLFRVSVYFVYSIPPLMEVIRYSPFSGWRISPDS